jgi:selenocysteine lyase/cysteine desulfurase
MQASSPHIWDDFRRQMPVASQSAYFDHAAVAPLTQPAQEAMLEWTNDVAQHGAAHWKRWAGKVEEARRTAAALVGAEPEEIALVHNTTEGISLVAEGFPWQPGDNVVIPADEFPSNLYPWMNLASRGVEVRQVAGQASGVDAGRKCRAGQGGGVDPGQIEAACDARTRIISVSWVGYATGFRCDLAALAEVAQRRGALLFVDAIQGLGAFRLDVRSTPIDFFAADGHKWLLGPEGAGLLYVRREHLNRLRPLGVGWNSVVHAGDFTNTSLALKPSAARYEGGTHNVAGIVGLGESLRLLAGIGPDAIGQRILEFTDEACRRLTQIGATIVSRREPPHASGIVLFDLPGQNPFEVKRRCLERGVVLNCRAGKLRLSPHAYNNQEDLDRLIESLA